MVYLACSFRGRVMGKRLAGRAALLAVPLVALAVLGVEAGSTSFGALPPVTDVPAVPQPTEPSAAAAKDLSVLDLKTWEETKKKSGKRR
jgi:hypothetical protein